MDFKLIALTLMCLGIAVLAGCKEDKIAEPKSLTGVDRLEIVTAAGDRHDYVVELALTPEQMQKGLMHRESMPQNAGMLFFFGQEDERGFFMRNTLIPLDMIFIKKNGRIHSIHENAKPLDETTIFSKGPVAAVLELNGGQTRARGIRPGDVVHHSFFGNQLAQ